MVMVCKKQGDAFYETQNERNDVSVGVSFMTPFGDPRCYKICTNVLAFANVVNRQQGGMNETPTGFLARVVGQGLGGVQ
ncbi:MAG: hypothetical protein NVSMB54_11900 [Ktedonobacteraceae bacterium]